MRLKYHIYSGLDGTAENREGIVLDITTVDGALDAAYKFYAQSARGNVAVVLSSSGDQGDIFLRTFEESGQTKVHLVIRIKRAITGLFVAGSAIKFEVIQRLHGEVYRISDGDIHCYPTAYVEAGQ